MIRIHSFLLLNYYHITILLFIYYTPILPNIYIYQAIIDFNMQAEQQSKSDSKLGTNQISIASFAKNVLSQPIESSLKLLPAYQNTHIAFCRYPYMEETVHFSQQGKILKRYTAQSCDSQIDMLSQFEVVMIKSIMKYNGDVRDFVVIWDLRNYTTIDFQFYAGYDEDMTLSVSLVVFKKSKMICVCEYQLDCQTKAVDIILSYYQPTINQGKMQYKKCHTYRHKCTQSELLQECMPAKLNQESMIGIINLGKYTPKVQFYVYQFDQKSNIGAGKLISLPMEQKNQENLQMENQSTNKLIKSHTIRQIGAGKLYVKYEQDKQTFQYIWDWKQEKCRIPSYKDQLKCSFYENQFFNCFQSPIKPNSGLKRHQKDILTTNLFFEFLAGKVQKIPINIIYLFEDQEIIGNILEIDSKLMQKKNSTKIKQYLISYADNRIVEYIFEDDGKLRIKSTQFPEFPFRLAEYSVWLVNEIVGNECDDDLLAEVYQLSK